MITNDDPTMARAMVCAQEACACALDRVRRNGGWGVIRIHLSPVYGSRDLKISVHGPWPTKTAAERHARKLHGHTFVLGKDDDK